MKSKNYEASIPKGKLLFQTINNYRGQIPVIKDSSESRPAKRGSTIVWK